MKPFIYALLALNFLFLFNIEESYAKKKKPIKEKPVETQPVLARPPQVKQLVPADLPPDLVFPSDRVLVVLELEVSETGLVQAARVVQGPGEPFDAAALAAARRFSFEPALLDSGEAVPVTIQFRMTIDRPQPPASATPETADPSKPGPSTQKSTIKAKQASPAPVTFVGQLLERGTRRPLSGVEVTALRAREPLASAVADAEGRFELRVPAVRFRLEALVPGYQTLDEEVVATPGERREERIFLEKTGLGFVTVVSSDRVKREVTRQVLPKEVVEKVPGIAGDTLKVIQILPGVARSAFDAGLVVLRGAGPGDSRVFLEGQEIPILYHFGGLRSSVSSVFLEAVEFIPGNFGPEYGRAIGGIVDVRLRDPAKDTIHGEVDLNLYDAGLALEGPISSGWSIGGAFRRSYIDSYLPELLPDDMDLSFETLPRYYDYLLMATWKPDGRKRVRIVWNGSMDKLELVFERPRSDPTLRGALAARVMFHDLSVAYRHRLGDRLSQDTSIQLGYQEISTVLGPDLYFDLSVLRLSVRSTWTYELLSTLALRAGLDINNDWVEIDLASPDRPVEGENTAPTGTRRFLGIQKTSQLYNPGAFVAALFSPMPALSFDLSLRFDWYREIEEFTVDPRLTIRLAPRSGTQLKAGFGAYHQPPTADQSDPDSGSPDLRAPASMQISAGVEQRVIQGLTVELTGFYKWLDSLVVRNPAYFSNPSLPPFVSAGTGRIMGLELLVKAQLFDRFQGWLSYTLQRSYRTDGPDAEERLFSFDQPHILSLAGTYAFGSGWSAGLRFRLVSGNPRTPVEGSIYDAGSGIFVPVYGASLSERSSLFHQLDLRVDKTFTFRLWQLSIYLDIQNVYYQKNEEGVTYNYDYTRSQPLTGLPILPILGLKGSF